jgi:phosphoglycolate phosphatase
MTYQNIIFDLDGTLIDSAKITGAILDQMLADREVSAVTDRAMIRAMDAVGGTAMIAAVLGQHTADPAADLEEFRRRHRRVEVPQEVLFPGIAAALDELAARGIGMAICSNKPQDLCEKILSELGVDHHFAGIFGSAPDRPRKPDPASALLALRALGGTANRTLFCGDSVVDADTAKAAGLAACLVAWGYGTASARAAYPGLPILHDIADVFARVHGEST